MPASWHVSHGSLMHSSSYYTGDGTGNRKVGRIVWGLCASCNPAAVQDGQKEKDACIDWEGTTALDVSLSLS